MRFRHAGEDGWRLGEDDRHYTFMTELGPALAGSDVVLTDSLPEPLRNDAYYERYQIRLESMQSAKPGALLNPCPPFYRGEEVSEEAISSPYFVGHAFKRHLISVQQAILLYCCGIGTETGRQL